MLVSENWLREWVDPKINTKSLADTLTMAGLEVSNIFEQKPQFSKVVVAQVIAINPHPQSSRLKLCKVAYGKAKKVNIVCGATNVFVDMKAPLAMAGAYLADGNRISKTTIRGAPSSGMLCSAMELGLADKSAGIMQLDASAELGLNLSTYLSLSDKILELELTPNRGDCLSIIGVARELSALTGVQLKQAGIKSVPALIKNRISIKINNPKGCPRYVGRIIQAINPCATTPDWMKEKLRRSGLRPISAIVDVTNFVMLELGQPMHAFDMTNINGGIIVRNAQKGEMLTLLDEKKLKLKEDDLLICDHHGPIALAGIMGGLRSGINENTTTVLLESAYFSQNEMIGKARRFGVQTDASYRFERGVDPFQQAQAIHRATRLLIDICGAKPGPVVEVSKSRHLPLRQTINVRYSQISKVLGVEINPPAVERYLSRLGCKVRRLINSAKVQPPAYRFDLNKEYDLIEEVARLHGYNNIPENLPSITAGCSTPGDSYVIRNRLRDLMIDRGYHETITYSFADPKIQNKFHQSKKSIKLINPISSNLSEMRLSLTSGLLQALANNYHRQYRQIRLFEIGSIFFIDKIQRDEEQLLGAISTGFRAPEQWGVANENIDFYDIKSDVEALFLLRGSTQRLAFKQASEPGFHQGRCARIYLGKKQLGIAGQLSPQITNDFDVDQDVYFFQVKLNMLNNRSVPAYQLTSRFPSTRRDLSIIVNQSVLVYNLLKVVESEAGKYLQDIKLFDVYTGKPVDSGQKSISLGLTFQALDRTLTEMELDMVCCRILKKLETNFNAQLRT